MEQHPVPQNISGFQFKLIGDITLKQFSYLALGVLFAYLSIKFDLIPSLLRWPLAAFWVIFGFGLAFVPIEERPLDRWLSAFVKSIYAPTQYVWKKSNLAPDVLIESVALPAITPIPPSPKTTPTPSLVFKEPTMSVTGVKPTSVSPSSQSSPTALKPIPMTPPPPTAPNPPPPAITPPTPMTMPKKSLSPSPKTMTNWNMGAPLKINPPPTPSPRPMAPMPSVTGKRVIFQEKKADTSRAQTSQTNTVSEEKIKSDFQQINQKLNDQIASLQKELEQGSVAKERFLELQQVLTQLLNEKERLSQELIKLRQQLVQQKETGAAIKPTEYTTNPAETKTTVKMVSPTTAKQAGIPTLTTQPNVITGIIKDSRGELLTNLIVTVKDKDGIPVRALKTNKLGQFAASTPLSNGVYIIEVEDPKKGFQFNRIEVDLAGLALAPLEISAISERDLMRQKLSRELFGKNTI